MKINLTVFITKPTDGRAGERREWDLSTFASYVVQMSLNSIVSENQWAIQTSSCKAIISFYFYFGGINKTQCKFKKMFKVTGVYTDFDFLLSWAQVLLVFLNSKLSSHGI